MCTSAVLCVYMWAANQFDAIQAPFSHQPHRTYASKFTNTHTHTHTYMFMHSRSTHKYNEHPSADSFHFFACFSARCRHPRSKPQRVSVPLSAADVRAHVRSVAAAVTAHLGCAVVTGIAADVAAGSCAAGRRWRCRRRFGATNSNAIQPSFRRPVFCDEQSWLASLCTLSHSGVQV